jgi:hypothetical protein
MRKNFFLFLALIAFLVFFIGVGYKKFNSSQESIRVDSVDSIDQKYLDRKASKLKEESKIKPNFCGNSYFPIIPGANWKYDLSFNEAKDILEITAPELKNEIQFLNIKLQSTSQTSQAKFFCSSEGITTDNLTFLSASSLNSSETIVDIEIQKVDGFFLPKNLNKTTSWNFELETIHRITASENDDVTNQNLNQDYTEKINITFNSAGEEGIDTSLGTIKTHRIDSWWIIEKKFLVEENAVAGDAGNNKAQITMATCTFWVGDQTGIVKSTYQEKSKQPVVLELRSFQIPAIQ